MGHSVVAYIALEMTRLWKEQCLESPNPFDIRSLILLTPTIHNISLSASGRIFTPALTYLPFLPLAAQSIVNALRYFISEARLRQLTAWVLRVDPSNARIEMLQDFLRSKRAVRQALAMATNEMHEIGHFSLKGWESFVASSRLEPTTAHEAPAEGQKTLETSPPKVYLLFAHSDHWVAEETRKEIITALTGESNTGYKKTEDSTVGGLEEKCHLQVPTIVVEEAGSLHHAWCLDEAETAKVVGRVKDWVSDTVKHLPGKTLRSRNSKRHEDCP